MPLVYELAIIRSGNNSFVAGCFPYEIWVLGGRRAAPDNAMALGRMLAALKAADVLNFTLNGEVAGNVHGLHSAFRDDAEVWVNLKAVEGRYSPQKVVQCRANYFPGTYYARVECDTQEIARFDVGTVASVTLHAGISEFVPVPGKSRDYRVELDVHSWQGEWP
jgi:hypothetical protein